MVVVAHPSHELRVLASVLRCGVHVWPVMAALLEMCGAGAHATPLDPFH